MEIVQRIVFVSTLMCMTMSEVEREGESVFVGLCLYMCTNLVYEYMCMCVCVRVCIYIYVCLYMYMCTEYGPLCEYVYVCASGNLQVPVILYIWNKQVVYKTILIFLWS